MSYEGPNYTQIPNLLLDEHLPDMSEAELRVTLVVARQTIGWHKQQDKISLSQLVEKTGMSNLGCRKGIQAALERGVLEREPDGQGFVYSLSVKPAMQQGNTEPELCNDVTQLEPELCNVVTQLEPELCNVVTQLEPELCNVVTPQKKELNKTTTKESGSSGGGSDRNRQTDTAYAEICTAVETNGFGMLTPFTAEEIQSLMDEYPQDWILDAMKISVSQNKRKLSYAAGILRHWRADGRDERKPEERQASWNNFNQDVPDYMQEMLSQ